MLNLRERWDVKDMFLDLTSQILIFLLVLGEPVLFNEGFSTELLFQAIWHSLNRNICLAFVPFSQFYAKVLSFLVSSVGRARRSAGREVAGSNPGRTNTQGL